MIHGIGVQIAIIQDNEILLIQREDFEVWGLPGGAIDPGETPAEAAIREAYEETGLQVRLTRLVGLYTVPQMPENKSSVLFVAEIIGGKLKTTTAETLDARFFSEETLPDQLIWWARPRILEALRGIGGSSVWTQEIPQLNENESRQELYHRRDESGMSRSDFFHSVFTQGSESVVIAGHKTPKS